MIDQGNIGNQTLSPIKFSTPQTKEFSKDHFSPKILTNLILKAPPESQNCQQQWQVKINMPEKVIDPKEITLVSSIFDKYKQKFDGKQFCQVRERHGDEDHRVKGKMNKKGKRDGQNIRTYARYDSFIQALEEELQAHKIYPTFIDLKLLDRFQMKSKRSLQRIFFYLLLAKRQNKLSLLLPNLQVKIRAKIQQKVGHRTSQFLKTLENCIQRYLSAAQKLNGALSIQQARISFQTAYLSDFSYNGSDKKPHHNKIRGVQKCLLLYKILIQRLSIEQEIPLPNENGIKLEQDQVKIQQYVAKDSKVDEHQNMNCFCYQPIMKKEKKEDDESFSASQSQLLKNPNEKKKKLGMKNKKQDERDIQKYAKFDIVSESSLEFLKMQRLHKNIPDICKKLSQRSLHFYFVILALIQKQKKEDEFLRHLQINYQRKVQKRYSQRSEYFRQRLHHSFFNILSATRLLFQGKLNQALDIAYEVRPDKKTHPAKAIQQRKCRQIYEAIRSSFEGIGEESKVRLDLLIQSDRGHRNQLIKQLKSPNLNYTNFKQENSHQTNKVQKLSLMLIPSEKQEMSFLIKNDLSRKTGLQQQQERGRKRQNSIIIPIAERLTSTGEQCSQKRLET